MYSKTAGSDAAEMLKVSLEYCREKMGSKEVLSLLKKNDTDVIEYFRFGLAKQVGSYLGKSSESIKEVYIYPDDEEPTLTLPLILIVHVEKYTAAVESAVEALQHILLDKYRNMFSPITNNLSVFLHVCFVDETDLLSRKGLATCISSLHRPALRVWNR